MSQLHDIVSRVNKEKKEWRPNKGWAKIARLNRLREVNKKPQEFGLDGAA